MLPDAFTVYDGSMFSNSPTTGDWETFIAKDLTSYIDGHYRTIADRSARGLAGHSMGGYGTVRIGMKHPEAFSVLYAMSSCCLMNDPQRLVPGASANQPPSGRFGERAVRAGRGMGAGHDESAEVFRSSHQRWRDPAADRRQMDRELASGDGGSVCAEPKTYRAIAIDVGTKDPFLTTNSQLDQALTRLGVLTNSRPTTGIMATASRPVLRRRCCPSFPRISPLRSEEPRRAANRASALLGYRRWGRLWHLQVTLSLRTTGGREAESRGHTRSRAHSRPQGVVMNAYPINRS